jgi:hypothetical protein
MNLDLFFVYSRYSIYMNHNNYFCFQLDKEKCQVKKRKKYISGFWLEHLGVAIY